MHKKISYKKPRKILYPIILVEIAAGTMAIITSLSLLLNLFKNTLTLFDNAVIQWIYQFRTEAMTTFMKGVTFFGGEIFISAGILIFFFALVRKHKISAFNFGFVLVFGTILNLLLKTIFQRARPDFLPLAHELTYSFPSGHAMNSFIFYSCIAYFIVRNTRNRKLQITTILLFGFIIILIGVSRIYLGVHYPSDVLGGYLAGLLWFILVVLVEQTVKKYKLIKISS